jgi:hypothetical protein
MVRRDAQFLGEPSPYLDEVQRRLAVFEAGDGGGGVSAAAAELSLTQAGCLPGQADDGAGVVVLDGVL